VLRAASSLAPHIATAAPPGGGASEHHAPQLAAQLLCLLAGRPLRAPHPLGLGEGALLRPGFDAALDACVDLLRYAGDAAREQVPRPARTKRTRVSLQPSTNRKRISLPPRADQTHIPHIPQP